MDETSIFEIIIVVGVLFLIVRNIRKDKSDGRTITGGLSGGGSGGSGDRTHHK